MIPAQMECIVAAAEMVATMGAPAVALGSAAAAPKAAACAEEALAGEKRPRTESSPGSAEAAADAAAEQSSREGEAGEEGEEEGEEGEEEGGAVAASAAPRARGGRGSGTVLAAAKKKLEKVQERLRMAQEKEAALLKAPKLNRAQKNRSSGRRSRLSLLLKRCPLQKRRWSLPRRRRVLLKPRLRQGRQRGLRE